MDIRKLKLGELAAFVCTELAKDGIEAVLSGGSCVTIHAAGRYVSQDMDFVLTAPHGREQVECVLARLGFKPQARVYLCPGVEFAVDILPPPPAVGGEPVKDIQTHRYGKWKLRLLSPTDCVKDRLAAYYHWDDSQALAQAIMVCESQKVDMNEVRRWSRQEGMSARFRAFESELRES